MSEASGVNDSGCADEAIPLRRPLSLDIDLDPAGTSDDAVGDLEGRRDAASRERALREDVPPHHG